MNLWLIWPLGISLWLVEGWIAFAIFEKLGFTHNNTAGYVTLSYFVYTVTKKWSLAIFLMGLGIGGFWVGLGVHFWWHWCPPGSISTGALSLPFSFN